MPTCELACDHFALFRSACSFFPQSDLRLHFGLGQAKAADLVEVAWPSDPMESFRNVPAKQLIMVEEARGIAKAQSFQAPPAKTRTEVPVR